MPQGSRLSVLLPLPLALMGPVPRGEMLPVLRLKEELLLQEPPLGLGLQAVPLPRASYPV